MNRKKISDTYKVICEAYFPLFDRKKQWVVKYSDKIAADGFCDDKNKIIFIGRTTSRMSLQLLLIHEICHAVSNPGHGKKWKNRMLMVAKQAVSLGERELATRIEDEIRSYDLGIKPTAQMAYNTLGDCIIDLPKASFETVSKLVAKEYGFSPQEFERRFKRSKRIYDEQKKV